MDPYIKNRDTKSDMLIDDTSKGIFKPLSFYLETPVQKNESGCLYNTIYLLFSSAPHLNCPQMKEFRVIISKYKVKLLNIIERMVRKIK